MKVFADLHHGDLFFSLHRLFEVRLGFELYRPIGLDWFTNGFWKIAEPYGNARDTINQYLDINERGYHQYKNLNGEHYFKDDVYHIYDPAHKYYQKAIIFDKFKSMNFDVIISSISSHEGPYTLLQRTYQPKAKLVVHMGNGGQDTRHHNVIYSIPWTPRPDQNTVFVHQELDPDIYQFTIPNIDTKNIYSMVNCLPYPDLYYTYKNKMQDVNFKAYGASCPDGALDGSRGVAAKMREANLGWQLKPKGGLGHTAMGWLYSGRAIITKYSEDLKTGGDTISVIEPGVTCHNIEAFSVHENEKFLRKMLEPEECIRWGERARRRFTDIINYDEEEKQVRKFLERLI